MPITACPPSATWTCWTVIFSAALGHAPGDATASAYDKATYFAERVEYVSRLADRLDVVEAGGNVVPLPRRA